MHRTRNDLPENVRTEMAELLNQRLADTLDLALRAKHAHWNVKGPHFLPLHELFDRVHGAAAAAADQLAERAAALGATAWGTLPEVQGASSLLPFDPKLLRGADLAAAVAESIAATGAGYRAAIAAADAAGDADTADLFTELSREADQLLWMVEAHQQADA